MSHSDPNSTSPARGAPRRRRRLLAALALLSLAPAAVIGHLKLQPGGDEVPATVGVAAGSIENTVTAVGSLQPRDYVDVGTQVSGQLVTVHVAIGDRVEKGQLIAEIDPTVYESRVRTDRANLKNLEAQLAQRNAELALARRQLERNRNMLAENAVSQDTVDELVASVQVLEAQIDALEAQTDAAEATLEGDLANLGYTRIHAPMPGTVTAQETIEGQTVNASQSAPTIFTVANLDVMTVWAQVAEADVNKVRPGMPTRFTTLGRPQQPWYGTVRQVRPTPETENDVVLYNVLIDVDNPQGLLLPEMTVQVFFVLDAVSDVPVVPLAALTAVESAGDDVYLATVLGDTGAETREVRVGLRDRRSAQVLSGLANGERVQLDAAPAAPARGTQKGSERGPSLGLSL